MTSQVANAAAVVTSVSRSHPGSRRTRNEDRVLERPDRGLWAVADGMGGHRDGGEAAERLLAALEAPSDARANGYARLAELERRATQVNAELYNERALKGGASGATLVALLLHEGHAACVWAGDSRAYLLRGAVLTRISRDHSVVQDLVETGVIGEDQRGVHPDANVVTRAVGAEARLDLDRRFFPVEIGDLFLLCSDGLTGCLTDAEITQLLKLSSPSLAAEALVDKTLHAGAPDNVSVVIVEWMPKR